MSFDFGSIDTDTAEIGDVIGSKPKTEAKAEKDVAAKIEPDLAKPVAPKAKKPKAKASRSERIMVSVTPEEKELLIKHRGKHSVAEFAYQPLSKFIAALK